MSYENRTFLYVEDDAMSRMVMNKMITRLDGSPSVTIYEDSRNFVERVRSIQPIPDAIFLDVQIGPVDGFGMLKLLRDEPTFDNVPIIAMTASVTVSEIEALREAGFDGLIAKPVRKRLFPELLERILDGEAVWYVP
jgi:two-component system, chemotaxis family, chemotaxis protein CheY